MLKNYLAIARPEHWFKNIFMLPGIVIALALTHQPPSVNMVVQILLAFIAASLIASANYTLNEWLDAKTDLHHPQKKKTAHQFPVLFPLRLCTYSGCYLPQ